MTSKFFSNRSIGLATYLGGPLAGGILIAINLEKVEEISKAVWTIVFSLLATTILFGVLVEMPKEIIDEIPNSLIPLLYTPLVVVAGKYLQPGSIVEALKEKENREHWWKSLVIGLVGTVLTLAIIAAISFNQPLFPGQKINYGVVKNEIYISIKADKKLADEVYKRLKTIGYFHEEFPQYAFLEVTEGYCKIIIYIDQTYWEEANLLASFIAFKWGMETETGKSVMLYLRHADLAGEKDKLLE